MKNLLSAIALVAVALPVIAAIAESFGLPVPAIVSAEVGLGIFVAAFTLLAFFSTYSAPRVARERRRRLPYRQMLPAESAFSGNVTYSVAHRELGSTATASPCC